MTPYEEQRATTYLFLEKLSEAWMILMFIQRCGRHLALFLETTYLDRSYYKSCSEVLKSCR